MRTPTWETSAGALAAFLNTATQGIKADLVTITLLGGQVLRYSAEDRAVTLNAKTFARGPLVLLGSTRLQVGIEVDTHEMTLVADATVQVTQDAGLSGSTSIPPTPEPPERPSGGSVQVV